MLDVIAPSAILKRLSYLDMICHNVSITGLSEFKTIKQILRLIANVFVEQSALTIH